VVIPSRRKTDLILLHAPSLYDFRKMPNLLGPISDVIPSTPIFEMYPVGFSSIASYLDQHHIAVRIINLAYRMLANPQFDVEKFIAKLKTRAFGIDLHWLLHAHGSIEIARICKKYHPDVPIIFGGYSATYFHEELIQYPAVDFVVRGDSTEESVRLLMQQIINRIRQYHSIPGLTWTTEQEQVIVNAPGELSPELNHGINNYKNLFKMAIKYLDWKNLTAIRDWWEYPITAVMTCRGCTQNCAICGGSQKSVREYVHRHHVSYRAPELVAKDIVEISRFIKAPIFIVGDLHQSGYKYAQKLFNALKPFRIKNELVFELFIPAREVFFDWLADAVPNFNFEMSPESHDLTVRKVSGKYYSNAELEQNIQWALERGCHKFDIFFMIGLPEQTEQSVLETVDYCEYLIERFGKRVVPFISPLAPFLDPGSLAYENAEQYGYRILFRTLEEYRQALLQPSWKYVFNYETKWMDRETIVQVTYAAGKRLTRLKAKYGLISPAKSQLTLKNIERALERHNQIESMNLAENTVSDRAQLLSRLGLNMEQDSISTICHKHEIRWPHTRRVFKLGAIAKAILLE